MIRRFIRGMLILAVVFGFVTMLSKPSSADPVYFSVGVGGYPTYSYPTYYPYSYGYPTSYYPGYYPSSYYPTYSTGYYPSVYVRVGHRWHRHHRYYRPVYYYY